MKEECALEKRQYVLLKLAILEHKSLEKNIEGKKELDFIYSLNGLI